MSKEDRRHRRNQFSGPKLRHGVLVFGHIDIGRRAWPRGSPIDECVKVVGTELLGSFGPGRSKVRLEPNRYRQKTLSHP